MRASHDSDSREFEREGFRVRVWIDGEFAVVSASPSRSQGEVQHERPALPSRSRLLVWGGRQGILRDQLKRCTRRARLAALLRRRSCPSPDEQLALLTDELLTAISLFEPSSEGSWAEPGGRAHTPPGRESLANYTGTPARRSERPWGILVAGGMFVLVAIATLAVLTGRVGANASHDAPPVATDMPSSHQPASADEDADPKALSGAPGSIEEVATALIATQPRYASVAGEEPDLSPISAANGLAREATIIPGQVLRLP